MSAERARGRELTELVTNHRLCDVHRHVLATVVHGERVTDHLREDGGGTRPRLDDLLLARCVHVLNALQETRLDVWSLLEASAHLGSLFPLLLAAADDHPVGRIVLGTRAVALCGHAPRRHRVTSGGLVLALATAVRVVDRVHRGTTHSRTHAEVPVAAGLAD